MKMRLRTATLAVAAALAWSLCGTPAHADEWNLKTIVTIDEAMKVPGATLQPGTYIFQLADPNTSRDVVNIIRESDNKLITSAWVRPMVRNNDEHGLALEVAMPGSSSVPMLKGWMYPGLGGGREFIYTKGDDARLIAHAETVEIPVANRG